MTWNTIFQPLKETHMQHLTELNRAYIARFANLDADTQAHIIEGIDGGGEVLSVYDLAAGSTVCKFRPVEAAAIPIWEYQIAESEAAVLGEAVQDALNLLPLDYKHDHKEKMSEGWSLQVVVRHDGPGAMLVYRVRNGYSEEVARLKIPEPIQH
jgi:hypothetical protein